MQAGLKILCRIFAAMETEEVVTLVVEQRIIASLFLKRDVIVDFYLPKNIAHPGSLHLLLINDGQDLVTMNFTVMFDALNRSGQLQPLLCVGIHAGGDRKMEYGTARDSGF